jgi:hypothetical protein
VPKGKPLPGYAAALPAKTSTQESRQFEMQMLTDAADLGGIVILARIAMRGP